MKTWKSLFVIAAVVAFASAAAAQGPAIGVFFDEEGTETHAELDGGLAVVHTAYICAVDAEMVVSGAAFKLVLDPQIMLLTATYPDGVALGEITAGVDVGLSQHVPSFANSSGALLCTLQLTTFDNLMADAPITITNNPNYATPILADRDAELHNVDGQSAYLTVSVGNEEMTWSEVKSLYN